MSLDLSCRDWETRLREGRSLVPQLQLPDPALGDRAVAIFNKLRLADVPGTPTMGEAGGDWFRDIVRVLFGSLDPATRLRLIVELFLLVPKKNSKTTNGALLMLTALLLNERPRAPFALVAPVQDTADEAFAAAEGAIELDEVLKKKFHVKGHLKTIVHRETKAHLKIITFDPKVLTGKKFVGTLIDELHVIAKDAKAAKALRQIRGGMVPFPEGFLAFITTMPDDAPVGVMKAELEKARAIRDGRRVGNMLPVLYEFPREMQKDKTQWMDPANWPMVTPNLGRSISLPKLIELYHDAAGKGEEEIRGWASQHLNVEIGLALLSSSWAGAEFWERRAIAGGLTLEQLIERSDVATIGIDGGGLDDLLGLCVIGRDRETVTYTDSKGNEQTRQRWLVWTRAWAHPIVLERRKEVAQQLLDLKEAGDLVIVENIGEDIDELADLVEQVYVAGLLERDESEVKELRASIGVDPVGIGAIVEAILARKIPLEALIGISQGWAMTGAIKTGERRLAEGTLSHGGQKLMAWCVGNARVEPRGNAIIVTKQASGSAKIDPLLAFFDAVSLMSKVPESTGKSFWEDSTPAPKDSDPVPA